jgi:hypothetical protein
MKSDRVMAGGGAKIKHERHLRHLHERHHGRVSRRYRYPNTSRIELVSAVCFVEILLPLH